MFAGLRRSIRNYSRDALKTYESIYAQSISNPEDFWAQIAEENTVWTKKWEKVLDNSNPPFTKWFVGGRLSLCYNAVDRHVDEGHGHQTALIWDSPITEQKSELTYLDLQKKVSMLAGLLSKLGVGKGDRVLIYMPMIPEAVEAMLATIRLGAIHSVVFGGFAAKELAIRIQHIQPKVILTANFGVEPIKIIEYVPIISDALEMANVPANLPCVMLERSLGKLAQITNNVEITSRMKQIKWLEAASEAAPHDCVDVEANEPLYVLYTSGTTGNPKGIQHPTGGHAVVNKWTMSALYGMNPGETWWAASDLGWIVGHEYICYSPLMARNTTVLYEGKPVGTPDSGQFFRVISEHNVKGFFVAPTALRAIKMADPQTIEGSKYDINCLKHLFVAGEHCDHGTRIWAQNQFKVPVLDNWWQTETGHAITASCIGLGNPVSPPKDASGKPVPGFDVRILSESGEEAGVNQLGRVVCKLPLPPGTLTTLYEADERFVQSYFKAYPGFYDTCDAGIRDAMGYIHILAREDDVINVAGHRLSTSALEEVALKHPQVAQVAVVGMDDELKGQLPLALYVPAKPLSEVEEEAVNSELVKMVRKDVGAVAAFKLASAVPDLPKTRSGKTPRKSLADLASGKQYTIPPTVENPESFPRIAQILDKKSLIWRKK